MVVDRKIREKAFSLYCYDVPIVTIASKLNINAGSIHNWINTYNWKGSRDEINSLAKESSTKSREIKQMQITDIILGLFAENVRTNRTEIVKKTLSKDVMEAIKLQRLLDNQSTENVQVTSEVMSVKEEVDRILREKGENE